MVQLVGSLILIHKGKVEKSAIEGGGVRRIMAKVMKNNHFFGGGEHP